MKDVVDSRRGFGRQTRRESRQPVVRVTRTPKRAELEVRVK